jgi:hypothetical protein
MRQHSVQGASVAAAEPGCSDEDAGAPAQQRRGAKMKKRVSWKRAEAEEIVEGGPPAAGGVDARGGRGGGELERPLEWGETFTWAVSSSAPCPCQCCSTRLLLAPSASSSLAVELPHATEGTFCPRSLAVERSNHSR